MEWTLGFAFAEIRNPSAGAVPFPSTQKKDEGEEEGKGQEGKEEEEITPGQSLMEQRCPNKSRTTTTTTTLDEDDSSDDEEDSSCGIKGSPHSPPAAMGFGKGCSDRVAQMDKRSNVQNIEA